MDSYLTNIGHILGIYNLKIPILTPIIIPYWTNLASVRPPSKWNHAVKVRGLTDKYAISLRLLSLTSLAKSESPLSALFKKASLS